MKEKSFNGKGVHDGYSRIDEEDREGMIQSICQSISMEYPYLMCGSHRIKGWPWKFWQNAELNGGNGCVKRVEKNNRQFS